MDNCSVQRLQAEKRLSGKDDFTSFRVGKPGEKFTGSKASRRTRTIPNIVEFPRGKMDVTDFFSSGMVSMLRKYSFISNLIEP